MSTKKLQILTPIVTSINGETGDVTIDMDKTAVGLDKVDNTSDADKPISTATKTALDGKQDKITAKGLLRGDGTGNIAAVDGSFLAYEPIADVEATTPIDADTLNGKTYDYINSTKQDKLTAGNNISIDNNVVSTQSIPYSQNLLKNWIFSPGFVVNQREQTTYTGTGYTIDMWKSSTATLTATIDSSGFTVAAGDSAAVYMNQYIEPYCQAGVLSMLAGAVTGTVYFQAHYTDNTFSTAKPVTVGLNSWAVDSSKFIDRVLLQVNKSSSVTMQAVKLEENDTQTLVHLNSDGTNWIYNEWPNYAKQLALCQRYFYRHKIYAGYQGLGYGMAFTPTRLRVYFQLPVQMRTTPTVSAYSTASDDMQACSTNLDSPPTFSLNSCKSMGWANYNTPTLEFTTSGLTQATMYQLRASSTSQTRYIDFSAEL